MSRTEKKCYAVSAGFHGLLLAVILFGAALMPEPEDLSSFKPITVYSAGSVSDLMSEGGEAGATSAPVAPPAAAVTQPPTAVPVSVPVPMTVPTKTETKPPAEPVKIKTEVVPPTKPEPRHDSTKPKLDLVRVEPPKNSKPKPTTPDDNRTAPTKPPKFKIDLKDLKKVDRTDSDKQAQADAQAANAAKTAQDKARAKQQKEFASSLRSLKNGLSSTTLVHSSPGVGGGGEATVNYGNIIFSRYYNAWIAPAMLEDDTPVVTVSVTIARSGQVISHHVLRSSGNRIMDRSVENALDNVSYIAPFPENSTDQERTVTIEFNLQAKKQTG